MKISKKFAILLIVPIMLLSGFSGAALVTHDQASSTPAVAQAAPAHSSPSLPASSAGSLSDLGATQNLFESIYSQVNPSVVNVHVVESAPRNSSFQGLPVSPFGFSQQQPTQQALGSGFVWDKKGDIVTNNHVVAGASQIEVSFSDGTSVPATVVGTDPNSDLAVIRVKVNSSLLKPVTLADSSTVKVGEIDIAIGNPYGLAGTMTQGIVSAMGRSLPVKSQSGAPGPTYSIPDIIQTDAAINPGNSGGVLLDTNGHVIGVTAAIQSPVDANAGIGFAIPSNIVNTVVTSLIQTGQYQHPWIGISGTSLTYDLAKAMNLDPQQKGALVVDVAKNGPAAKAGLQGSNQQTTINGQQVPVGGDVITAINGQPVTNFEDLASILFNSTQAGQTIKLTILRNGQTKTVSLTLGVLPKQLGG
ncbi:MAG: trypsin-like peptidase domain-containing protein [Anaerolineales bacterium]|jgi:2-alkenal reductase